MFEQIIGNVELLAGDVVLNFFAEVIKVDSWFFSMPARSWRVQEKFLKLLKTVNRLKIEVETSKGPGILC